MCVSCWIGTSLALQAAFTILETLLKLILRYNLCLGCNYSNDGYPKHY